MNDAPKGLAFHNEINISCVAQKVENPLFKKDTGKSKNLTSF